MSKGILIVDIPNIEDCEIDSYDMVADVQVKALVLGAERYDCEFENVIVRPLPQKKDDLRYLDSYAKGFNDCIDEILEGEKDD